MTHIILLDGKLWAFEPPEKPEFCSEFVGRTDGMGALECSFPEELTCMCGKKWFEYHSAYSLALEQKLEVDRSSFTDSCLISRDGQAKSMSFNVDGIRYYLDVNEPIKWEGKVQIIGIGHNGEFKTKYERTVARLIAPVKEENSNIAPTEVQTYAGTLHIGGDALGWQRDVDKWIENEKKGIPPITGREKLWRLKRAGVIDDDPVYEVGKYKGEPVPSEQENQEEMWREVFDLLENLDIPVNSETRGFHSEITEELIKKKFHLTRK